MAWVDKLRILRTIFAVVKTYDTELNNRNLLFICINKHKRVSTFELSFDKSNFQHLTGCVTDKGKITTSDFYDRCIDERLSVEEFEIKEDRTTEKKIDVLPLMITKNLSADSIGVYKGNKLELRTDKLAGNVKACMGFVLDSNNNKLVPNTLLQEDIRNITEEGRLRIIATYRKYVTDEEYSENVYVAKKVDWSKIKLPDEYSYLVLPSKK